MKKHHTPKKPDPLEAEIKSRLYQLRDLQNRAPAKQSLKAIQVQLKALSVEAGRLVTS